MEIGNPAHLLGADAAGVAAAQIADLEDSRQIAAVVLLATVQRPHEPTMPPSSPDLQPDDWQGFGD